MTAKSILKIALYMSVALAGAVNAQVIAGGHYAPAVGANSFEAVLITINADNSITTVNTGQGAYDSSEDTLVAVLNLSSSTLTSLQLSNPNIFGFEADGIASASYLDKGTTWGPTGYEGPNTSFTITNKNSGVVNFTNGLTTGQSAYFSLEEAPNVVAAATVTNVSPVPEPESYAMMLAGLGLFGFLARRKNKEPASA